MVAGLVAYDFAFFWLHVGMPRAPPIPNPHPHPNPNPNANPSPNADANPRQVGMHLAPSLGRAVGHGQHHQFDGKQGGKHGGGAASESAL